MTTKAFENEFLKTLELLNKEQQNKAITYLKSLVRKTKPHNQDSLLQFAGSLKPEDIQEISIAIVQGCENIDKNEW